MVYGMPWIHVIYIIYETEKMDENDTKAHFWRWNLSQSLFLAIDIHQAIFFNVEDDNKWLDNANLLIGSLF